MTFTKNVKTFAAPMLLAASLSVPAIWLSSSPSFAATCGVFAKTPTTLVPGDVDGSGGRHHCTSSVTVKVELKWNRSFSPDPVLDFRSGTFVNVTLNPYANCLSGSHEYYVDTNGNGYATSDPRKTANCAN